MKQTVTSKYEPKSKNVTWIDMSSGSPIQKNFINGMWRPTGGSGGGGGTSNPTEADATKVWQVTPVQKGTKIGEIVIAPMQTMNINHEDENSKILQNVSNLDKFVAGAEATIIFDDVEYNGIVEANPLFEGSTCGINLTNFVILKFPAEVTGLPEDVLVLMCNDGQHSVYVNIIGEVPVYDYNWAPGVKIPIPTAEDEGKILVVTKTEGDTSIIVPEQQVPIKSKVPTPLTNVDLTKFVVGNTVKVTVSANSQTFTATGVIEEGEDRILVSFNIDGDSFAVWQEDNLLYTNKVSVFGNNSTIKLECIEFNYEYQLQQNSGGSSDVLWPALYKDEFGNEIMATLVPENVKPGTWCMVCGTNSSSRPVCYPALINEYGDYTLYSGISGIQISVNIPFDGVGGLLTIISSNAI